MVDVRQHTAECRRVAQQFVGDHHPRFASVPSDDATQKDFRGALISSLLDQGGPHHAVFVDRTPQPVAVAFASERSVK